jgi:hypothetical protein
MKQEQPLADGKRVSIHAVREWVESEYAISNRWPNEVVLTETQARYLLLDLDALTTGGLAVDCRKPALEGLTLDGIPVRVLYATPRSQRWGRLHGRDSGRRVG